MPGADRGRFLDAQLAPKVLTTVHPSSILRSRSDAERRAATARFVEELRLVARALE